MYFVHYWGNRGNGQSVMPTEAAALALAKMLRRLGYFTRIEVKHGTTTVPPVIGGRRSRPSLLAPADDD